MRIGWRGLGSAALLTLLLTLNVVARADDVLVYAAASTSDALTEVGTAYEKNSGDRVHFSFASSATLAQQILAGAPADMYVSANENWMDVLQRQGKLLPDTRRNFVANQLVLIAPRQSLLRSVRLVRGLPLAELLGDGLLAIANPDHVPAGIYAEQSLQALGVWQAVAGRLVRGDDVRVTLNYVAHGGVPLGIVYATDAAATHEVKQLGVFPADSHDAIVYPMALIRRGNMNVRAAQAFYAFMCSGAAARIMARHGFTVLMSR